MYTNIINAVTVPMPFSETDSKIRKKSYFQVWKLVTYLDVRSLGDLKIAKLDYSKLIGKKSCDTVAFNQMDSTLIHFPYTINLFVGIVSSLLLYNIICNLYNRLLKRMRSDIFQILVSKDLPYPLTDANFELGERTWRYIFIHTWSILEAAGIIIVNL